MTTLVFDCETNGLLDALDRIHCISIRQPSSRVIDRYTSDDPDGVEPGLERLLEADVLVGHNIMAFDVPAIQKVYPTWKTEATLRDTLVLSRTVFTDLKTRDAINIQKRRLRIPPDLIGSHSLEAWGHRLGFHKGDYQKEMEAQGLDPWAHYNDAMGEYCDNDADLNTVLWQKLCSLEVPEEVVRLEHRVWRICLEQMENGVAFDEDAALELYAQLSQKREEMESELRERFGFWFKREKQKTPKRNNSRYGYVEGCPFTPIKRVDFNPGSRDHIANRLKTMYGWKPKVFTDTGKPKVDEAVLSELDYPEAQRLCDYLLLKKRVSQLAEGDTAWLKHIAPDGRIYGRINPNGTITGRAAHSSPNLGQVPNSEAEYGPECRALFVADRDLILVGADLASLELRLLAHYLAYWDEGAYAKVVLEGDPHEETQEAIEVDERGLAKRFFYAFIYGAGDEKLGATIGKGKRVGKRLREMFMERIPAFGHLIRAVQSAAKKRKYLRTLGGRKIPVRSQYAALNTLLQSAGGVIIKQAMCNLHDRMAMQGYVHQRDYWQVLWVHDELQMETAPDLADFLGQQMVESFEDTTQQFNLNIPMSGDYAVGQSWAETH